MNEFEQKALRRLNIITITAAVFLACFVASIAYGVYLGVQYAREQERVDHQRALDIACRVNGDC